MIQIDLVRLPGPSPSPTKLSLSSMDPLILSEPKKIHGELRKDRTRIILYITFELHLASISLILLCFFVLTTLEAVHRPTSGSLGAEPDRMIKNQSWIMMNSGHQS